jgi:hypothetical protein
LTVHAAVWQLNRLVGSVTFARRHDVTSERAEFF